MKITKVLLAENDVLLVEGTVEMEHGGFKWHREVFGKGYQSAVTNFYPPEAYDEDGRRKPGIDPRNMTKDERTAYYYKLLEDANPVEPEPVEASDNFAV